MFKISAGVATLAAVLLIASQPVIDAAVWLFQYLAGQ